MFDTSRQRWKNLDILVIDEASMLSGKLFDYLNNLVKSIRRTQAPFGGIQLVLVGDFFQLPPPTVSHEGYAFQSMAWKEVIGVVVELTQLIRQRKDELFLQLLQEVRLGSLHNQSSKQLLQSRILKKRVYNTAASTALDVKNGFTTDALLQHPDPASTVHLFSSNHEASTYNSAHLKKIIEETGGISYLFTSVSISNGMPARFERNHNSEILGSLNNVPQCLELVKGAKVILTRSIKIFNELLYTTLQATYRQKLSEKTEGDNEASNFTAGVIFGEPGQIVLVNGTIGEVTDFIEFASTFEHSDKSISLYLCMNNFILPKVKFQNLPTSVSVYPQQFSTHQLNVSQFQLPLRLGWALTIHRSQGMTLSKAVVHLSKCFCPGQAYVALSRVRTSNDVQIASLSKRTIIPNKTVLTFYKDLAEQQANEIHA